MKQTPLRRKTPLHKQPFACSIQRKASSATAKATPGSRSPISKKKPKAKVPTLAVLDSLFSRYIRRFGDCQLHGYGGIQCSNQLQCSHIKSRKYHSVRWSELNAICVCAKHHFHQHAHPDQNRLWLAELLGEDHLERLQQAWLNGRKPTADEKRALATWLRDALRECA